MKNNKITLLFILCASIVNYANAQTPSTSQNYVMSKSVFVEGKTTMTQVDGLTSGQYAANINYFDGLGRLIQEVAHKASANNKDIITPHEYDPFGREEKQFLQYVATGTNGAFRSSAISELNAYRNSPSDLGISDAENYPYSLTVFDDTPLNRTIKQGAPGADWQPNSSLTNFSDHVVKYEYATNESGAILKLRGVNQGSVTFQGAYGNSELMKSVVYDEDNHEVIVFTDRQGQTILKRVVSNNSNLDTYYIYDEFGRLSIVIQPEGVAKLMSQASGSIAYANCIVESNGTVTFPNGDPGVEHQGSNFKESPGNIIYRTGGSVTLSGGFHFNAEEGGVFSILNSDATIPAININTILDKFAFRYEYDGRGRMIRKYVPGAGWTSYVYDKRNLLRFVQDEVQDDNNEWLFIKYDELDREIQRGIYSSSNSRATLQTNLNSNQDLPTGVTNADLIMKNYYDNYDAFSAAYNFNSPYSSNYFTQPHGLLTGTKVKVLGSSQWITTVTYYDEKQRPIHVVTDNHMGGIDKISSELNFAGWLLRSRIDHNTSVENITIVEQFTYDHMGRQLNHYHKIDNNPEILLSSNTYNNLGELIDKKLYSKDDGMNFQQSVDYRYNVRGWLTSINNAALVVNDKNDDSDDYWGMTLGYNNSISGVSASLLYNGNISAVKWSSDDVQLGYSYTYDGAHRLLSADHMTVGLTNSSDFDVTDLSYDMNGNILGLSRHDKSGAMDILNYNYGSGNIQSNQLLKVDDSGDIETGFKDGNTSGNDYDYDANGNMTMDLNKNIESITYNYLNLPEIVRKDDGQYVLFIYDAAGIKLTMEVYDASSTLQKRTNYIGGFIYEQEGSNSASLQIIQHTEGRIVPDAITGIWEYQYYLKDHLGNTRVTFTSDPDTYDFKGTFESEKATEEDGIFENINRVTFNAADANSDGGNEVVRVNGTQPMGAGISLPVSRGDELDMEVLGYYEGGSGYSSQVGISSFISAIAGGFGGNISGTEAQQATFNAFDNAINGFGMLGTTNDNVPAAYLNYILFDENMVSYQHGHTQISGAANMAHEKISLSDVVVSKAGFVYVYISNESASTNWVYFDDMKITLKEHAVIQTNDYYPGGLTFNSYKRSYSAAQNYLYNGKERQPELGWDDFGARMYMPDLMRWNAIDPMADERTWVSPYNYVQNNPINRIDPDGAFDWVLNGDNEIYWDDNANSQATTQAGETYLGKELTFTFNSNIDGELWDGPGGSAPVGDKLTSTVTLSASENSDGQLTGISATKDIQVGSTPIGTARDYFPGLGSDQNQFSTSQSTNADGTLSSFSLNFQQHASVSPIEGFGLNMMGFDIVNVAQQMNISTSGSQLSISAGTDVFPSASLSVNGTQLFQYNQPSFRATHGRDTRTVVGDNGRGGSYVTETTPRRPTPRFYNRYKK